MTVGEGKGKGNGLRDRFCRLCRPGGNGVQPPGKAASDAFERTGMGGGDSHITTRKTRDWVSSRDSRRELEEEEVETLARSSSAHGQSAGSRQVRTDARNGAPL